MLLGSHTGLQLEYPANQTGPLQLPTLIALEGGFVAMSPYSRKPLVSVPLPSGSF